MVAGPGAQRQGAERSRTRLRRRGRPRLLRRLRRGPGTWLGRGIAGFSPSGEVDRDELGRLLAGQHPRSGRQLLDARGSATRADHLGRATAKVAAGGPDDELLSISQTASLLRVSPQHLRTVVAKTVLARREIEEREPMSRRPRSTGPYLAAARNGPDWPGTSAGLSVEIADRHPCLDLLNLEAVAVAQLLQGTVWLSAEHLGHPRRRRRGLDHHHPRMTRSELVHKLTRRRPSPGWRASPPGTRRTP